MPVAAVAGSESLIGPGQIKVGFKLGMVSLWPREPCATMRPLPPNLLARCAAPGSAPAGQAHRQLLSSTAASFTARGTPKKP